MKVTALPAFRVDGSIVQLCEVCAVVPENNWTWRVLDFNGMGIAPNDLSMAEFESLVRSMGGIDMHWLDFKKFAEGLEQTIDCLIVAAKDTTEVSVKNLADNNFSGCEVVIEAIDSTEWLLWARESSVTEKWLKSLLSG